MLKTSRFLLAGLVFFLGSLVLVVRALFKPFSPLVALEWCRSIPPLGLKLMGIDIEYRHHERMKKYHPCVFVGNHQHALDLFVHGGAQSVPTVAIGKKEVKWIPFFGWIFWLTGNILINRQHRESALSTMAEVSKITKARGLSVWMFPEGTRSHGRGLLLFKKGAFHLAIAGQVPIVPVVSSHFFPALNLNRWHAGKVVVEVLEAIPTKGLSTGDVDSLIEKTREIMKTKIEELDREVLSTAKNS